ncbi:MAG: zinc-binding dehydrogenase [Trueperaceae bacterium]
MRELSYQGLGGDVVYECSGAGPASAQLLNLVRRKGRYVQIGLFGKAVAFVWTNSAIKNSLCQVAMRRFLQLGPKPYNF